MDTVVKDENRPAVSDDFYQHLMDLYEGICYQKAYEFACAKFGPINSWTDNKLVLLGARIQSQFGAIRACDATILKLWRSGCRDEFFLPFYVSTIKRRRGPLAALDILVDIRASATISDSCEAELCAEEADIYIAYRDFSAAQECLDKSATISPNKYTDLLRVELKTAEDNYEQALVLSEALIAKHPGYRSAIQQHAELLQISGDTAGAIEQLKRCMETSESWWVAVQLFSLSLEAKDYELGQACLDHLEGYLVLNGVEGQRQFNRLKADLLCAQQRYEEAIPLLETKNLYSQKVKESIEKGSEKSRQILDVPFVRQANMTCAPASLTAVSRYWGVEQDQQEIVDAICYGGTQSYDERRWSLEKGWSVSEFDLVFETIKQLIDKGIPVLLSTVEPGSGHLQIIVGYDEKMGTYILRDPFHPRLQEFLIQETASYYASNGPRCMVIVPASRSNDLEAFDFRNQFFYDGVFELNQYLTKNDRHAAIQIVQKLKETDPSNRLSIVAERILAVYDGDENRILQATERLLELYPEDVNYQLSKLASLKRIGAGTEALEYLQKITKHPNSHFLLLTRLARETSWDHRNFQSTEALYKKLLKRNPLDVETLYGYAGMLWDLQLYQRSYQLYRFCTCLEEINEGYAESYFKAARFHRDTELALEFLRSRYERLAGSNSGPTISLYEALNSINRDEEAFVALEEGMKRRPDDPALKLFAARQYVYSGQVERGQHLLSDTQALTSPVAFNEAAIDIYEASQDSQKALKACEQVLEYEPLNAHATKSYARLLIEVNRRADAIQFLKRQLELYPDNLMLKNQLVKSLAAEDFEQKRAVYESICASHPDDTAAHRELSEVLICLGLHQKAIEAAETAVSINSRESANYGYLGDAYLAINDREKAKKAFKQSIVISCDYSYAYDRLTKCSFDLEQQKTDLAFIHKELMQQVSYGGGILEFPLVAKPFLEAEKIEEFLQHALDKRPDLWQSWVALTIQYRQQNELDKSEQVAARAVEKFPLLPRMHYEYAEAKRLSGGNAAAIDSLKKCLELSPGWSLAANSLCDLYASAGDFEQAIALQEQMIRRSPLEASPYGYLADLYCSSGREEEAVDALEKAIKLDVAYTWAWRKLHQLRENSGSGQTVISALDKAIATHKDIAALIDVYIDIVGSEDMTIAHIEKYLQRNPNDIDVCSRFIHLLVERKEFTRGLALVAPDYWQGTVPIAMQANEAWIYAQQDNKAKAIQLMRQVASTQPNYYDAWRFLTIWYAETGKNKQAQEAIQNCARIYPHDTGVLCFCAEKTKEVGGDKNIVVDYLRRCFQLNPSDQYNGLTYIDELLDYGKNAEAEIACDKLLQFQSNPYVYLRAIRIAINKGDISGALDYFDRSLDDAGQPSGLLVSMWEYLAAKDLHALAAEQIEGAHQAGRNLHPDAGKCLGLHDLATMKLKQLEKKLLNREFQTAFDHRYLEPYLRELINKNQLIARKLEESVLPRIKEDLTNWGLYAYCLLMINGRESEAARFFSGIENEPGVDPWVIYYASIARRWIGQWDEGKKLIELAYDLPADQYRNDILIWRYFDHMLGGGELDPTLLEYLDRSDLEPISKYVVIALRALVKVQRSHFIEKYNDVSFALRECQHRYQPLAGNPIVEKTKKVLRQRLKETLPEMPFFKKMIWQWRLSNHF